MAKPGFGRADQPLGKLGSPLAGKFPDDLFDILLPRAGSVQSGDMSFSPGKKMKDGSMDRVATLPGPIICGISSI